MNRSLELTADEDEDVETPFYLRVPDPAADTEYDAMLNVAAEELHRQLDALSPTEAWVLRARFGLAGADRLSVRQVARVLQVAVSTAHSLERRGLLALRAANEVPA